MTRLFCDRCGVEIDDIDKWVKIKYKTYSDNEVERDICKVCYRDFRNFMNNPLSEKIFIGNEVV